MFVRQIFSSLILIVTGISWAPVQAQSISVIDDTGQTVSLPGPAKRIISLSPHITELMFAAGAGDKLVGVVEYSDYPEAAKKIERIGNHSSIDLERISLLNPDLVVAWDSGNPKAAIEQIRKLGYPLFLSEPRSLQDISSSMQRFAKLANTESAASKVIRGFEERFARLKNKYRTDNIVKVFYEIWYQPMMTVNGKHIISEVVATCGGENVFAGLGGLAPSISVESVIAANPQAIIAGSNIGERLFDWKKWAKMDAVRFNNLFHVEWDHINRHSPRILDAMVQVCDALNVARQNMHRTVDNSGQLR